MQNSRVAFYRMRVCWVKCKLRKWPIDAPTIERNPGLLVIPNSARESFDGGKRLPRCARDDEPGTTSWIARISLQIDFRHLVLRVLFRVDAKQQFYARHEIGFVQPNLGVFRVEAQ